MGVEVVDNAPSSSLIAPARGQRWRKRNGLGALTIASVDGPAVIGYLDSASGAELWAADRAKLEREFQPEMPVDLRQVSFDVDRPPTDLMVVSGPPLFGPLHLS